MNKPDTHTRNLTSTAGHDVLAITLRAIWYYLARHDRVRDKLRDEIRSASGGYPPESFVPFSEVSKLPYLYVSLLALALAHPPPPPSVPLPSFSLRPPHPCSSLPHRTWLPT